jgi:glycosyltransferase involved in cell wall biosynthesis
MEFRGEGVIVYAVPDFEPAVGGTTTQTGLQARALANRGAHVVVLTLRSDPAWARRERVGGIDVRRLGLSGRGRLREWTALVAMVVWLSRRRRSIAAVQTVMWTDASAAAALSRLSARTVVLWAIDGEARAALRGGSPWRRLVTRVRAHVLRRSRHVALTPAMLGELAEVGLAEQAMVIPVPVDTRHFRPPSESERAEARREIGIGDASFTITYVGHLQARKAVDRLIEAFAALLTEAPDARLVVVGGSPGGRGDVEDALRLRAAELGLLAGEVLFCGVVTDPRPHLWASDVSVLPSFREGMPNSLLEAMSCGLACVAPPSAGGSYLLEGCGVVPPSNDPGELRDALRALFRDPARRAALGAAARERAREFDVDNVVTMYERLYREPAAKA